MIKILEKNNTNASGKNLYDCKLKRFLMEIDEKTNLNWESFIFVLYIFIVYNK